MPGWKKRREALLAEIESHIEMEVQERIDAGASPEEARAEARKKFGNALLAAEHSREIWGGVWLERLFNDLSYALRRLIHAPGYTVTLILTLALGLGSVTAMLAIVDSVLLRPVALPHSEQLALIYVQGQQDGTTASSYSISYKQAGELRHTVNAFAGLSAYNIMPRPVGAQDGTQIALAVETTPDLFTTLGVHAQLGRLMEPVDSKAPVAVINYDFWRNRLHSDPKVIGTSIQVSGGTHVVIGVLPASVYFPLGAGGGPAVYLPIMLNAKGEDSNGFDSATNVLTRLKSGISVQQARAEAQSTFAHIDPAAAAKHNVLKIEPYRNFVTGDVQKPLLMLLGGVGVLLLIACANAANLQIGRAVSRMEEMQIRSALGASFMRLAQQLLAESIMASLAGAVLGGGMAYAAVAAVRKAYGDQYVRFDELAVHPEVLAACALLAVLVGAAATLAPMLRIRKRTRAGMGTRTVTRTGPLPGILVSLQVALTCVLLAVCGLFARTFQALEHVKLGFDPHNVTTLVLVPENPHQDAEVSRQMETLLLQKFKTLPGVESVTMQTSIPFSSFNMDLNGTTDVEGRTWRTGDSAHYSMVSTDFVRTSGIRLLRGRGFTQEDETGSGAIPVLVNEAFVQKYFAGREPVGAWLKAHRDPGDTDADMIFTQAMTIVGVVENELQGGDLGAPFQPMIYLDYLALPKGSMLTPIFSMSAQYAVRSNLAQDALDKELRAAVKQEAPQMVEMSLAPMEDSIANSLSQRRLALRLVGGFGLVALLLSAIGIYGVLAYAVTQRRREIGVRMALGASRQRVTAMVVRQAGAMVLFGLIPGIAGAWAAGYAIRSFLFGVKDLDVLTLAAVGVLLLAVSALAAFVPALRAAWVNPVEMLRAE